MSFLNAHVTDS